MPIGHWKDFAACVKDLSRKYGKESATRICGSIEAKARNNQEYNKSELDYMNETGVSSLLKKKHDIKEMDESMDCKEIT